MASSVHIASPQAHPHFGPDGTLLQPYSPVAWSSDPVGRSIADDANADALFADGDFLGGQYVYDARDSAGTSEDGAYTHDWLARQPLPYKTLSLSPRADECIDLASLVGSHSPASEGDGDGDEEGEGEGDRSVRLPMPPSVSAESNVTVVPGDYAGNVSTKAPLHFSYADTHGQGSQPRRARGPRVRGGGRGGRGGQPQRTRVDSKSPARSSRAPLGSASGSERAPSPSGSNADGEFELDPDPAAHASSRSTSLSTTTSEAHSDDEDEYEIDEADDDDAYSTASSDYRPRAARRYHPYQTEGARGRTGSPVPVPHLTKKSRGRKVPVVPLALFAPSPSPSSPSATSKPRRGRARREQAGAVGERAFRCEVEGCGKCFIRGEHLKRHVRSIHTEDKRESFSSLLLHLLACKFAIRTVRWGSKTAC
ncbi:hypothetical protein HWV62_28146 [Athelia sp. TMB]|nr:hypothetical protein HWV62_28146 [Athelia sp. TMB]